MPEIIGNQPDPDRPVLFLDFDDVVNIFDDEVRTDPSGFHCETVTILRGTAQPRGGTLPEDKEMHLIWDNDVVDALREMNVVWISSWKQLTQDVLNPVLGFDFGYVDWQYRGFSDTGHDGKRSAIIDVSLRYGFPAIAVADDSFYSHDDIVPGIDCHVVQLDFGGRGLTAADISELSAFMGSAHEPAFKALLLDELEDGGYVGRVYCPSGIDAADSDAVEDLDLHDRPWVVFETEDEAVAYGEYRQSHYAPMFGDKVPAVFFLDLNDGTWEDSGFARFA